MRPARAGLLAAATIALLSSQLACAETPKGIARDAQPAARTPDVVVFGCGEAKPGVAAAASKGTVAGSDLLVQWAHPGGRLFSRRDRDIARAYESYPPAVDSGGPVKGRLSCVMKPGPFGWA